MADAAEQLDRPLVAIASLRALQQMDPVDPAGLHYQMAKTLAKLNAVKEAKHHVLAALAEAPRYRDAHRLLLKLTGEDEAKQPQESKTQPKNAQSKNAQPSNTQPSNTQPVKTETVSQ